VAGGRPAGLVAPADDARRVAQLLDIPFFILNVEREFGERVIDTFVDSYLDGATPNPCQACNQYIKFDELLKRGLAAAGVFGGMGPEDRSDFATRIRSLNDLYQAIEAAGGIAGAVLQVGGEHFVARLQGEQLRHHVHAVRGVGHEDQVLAARADLGGQGVARLALRARRARPALLCRLARRARHPVARGLAVARQRSGRVRVAPPAQAPAARHVQDLLVELQLPALRL
jgi:hypothetical protein